MSTTINDVRFSYINVFQPKPPFNDPTGEPKYSLTVLVPKSNVQAKAIIDAAIQEAINAGVSKAWGGQQPPMPAICVHDGDGPRPSDGSPFGEECRGCWVFKASCKQPPFVVDAQVQPIMDPREVYSGMWGNVNVDFFAYNTKGKKGIGCGLNGIQKIRDDEPLTNRVTAEEAFKPVAPAYGAQQLGYMPQSVQSTPGYAPAPAPSYAQPAAPAAYTPAPATVPAGYGQPAAPAAPTLPAQPTWPTPAIDPITGQPIAPQGYNPTGTPIMGL